MRVADDDRSPQMVLRLCGGGYRASLFHLGVLWRLNDARQLSKICEISAVSGGSIVAAALAANWERLDFQQDCAANFQEQIVKPVREFASTSLEAPSSLGRLLTRNSFPRKSQEKSRNLTRGRTLADLPDNPNFVFRATSLHTGTGWEFSKACIRDTQAERILKPGLDLAEVICASAALPPLPPAELDLLSVGQWCAPEREGLSEGTFGAAKFCDGCATDRLDPYELSLGKTLLVSDAGNRFEPTSDPGLHWWSADFGLLSLSEAEQYQRRRKDLREMFSAGGCKGGYWDIAGACSAPADVSLPRPEELIKSLAQMPTALTAIDEIAQKNLIDWGFSACDTAIRACLDEGKLMECPDAAPYGTFYRPLTAAAD